MMPDNHEVSGKGRRRVHMAMEVSDPVNDCPVSWLDLGIEKISFDTDVMVAGKYLQGDSTANASRIPGIS